MTAAVEWRLRRMTSADVPQVMAIEHQAFSHPWTEGMVRSELTHDWSTVLLAEALDGSAWVLRGFVIYWLVVDEVHVLNVATDSTFRRQGVARRVLNAVLETGRAQRCRLATLEVRASNTAAKALYASLGF
ncbi:MAG: GNAT family N-acetyltransferase, partial [Archangium sp.]|nr:GNAT family N-acetyltransferase [Archangium sp.]